MGRYGSDQQQLPGWWRWVVKAADKRRGGMVGCDEGRAQSEELVRSSIEEGGRVKVQV